MPVSSSLTASVSSKFPQASVPKETDDDSHVAETIEEEETKNSNRNNKEIEKREENSDAQTKVKEGITAHNPEVTVTKNAQAENGMSTPLLADTSQQPYPLPAIPSSHQSVQQIAIQPAAQPTATPLPPPPLIFEPKFVERSGWLSKLSHKKGI